MNMGAEKKNLDASIGQTYQPINESFGICVNRLVACFRFVIILFCVVGLYAPPVSKKQSEVAQIKTVIKLLLRAELAKISAFQKRAFIKDLKLGTIAVAQYGALNSLTENQQRVGILAESEDQSAGELLQALFDYYKLLFCFYCLKGAQTILPDKGQSLLPAIECFFTFLWDEDKGWQKNKPEKMKFVKSAMLVVAGAENAFTQYSDFDARNTFVRKLLQKIHPALPECDLERQHSSDTCHRCSALNVIDMVALGIIEKKVFKRSEFQKKTYRFLKIAVAVGVGCIVLWKVVQRARKAGFFSQERVARCMKFIKKHIHFE